MHSEWHYIMWIHVQEKQYKSMKDLPFMCPTIFMIYQLGYQLNLKHVTVQFNVTTHSRQKTLIVYIINEHCKLLHVKPKKLCPKNDTQKLTLVVFPKQSHKLQMTGHIHSHFWVWFVFAREDHHRSDNIPVLKAVPVIHWEKLTSPCKLLCGKSKHNTSFAMHYIRISFKKNPLVYVNELMQ